MCKQAQAGLTRALTIVPHPHASRARTDRPPSPGPGRRHISFADDSLDSDVTSSRTETYTAGSTATGAHERPQCCAARSLPSSLVFSA
jgi:hypothetical protein